jgi:excisionase family DNA binding protein
VSLEEALAALNSQPTITVAQAALVVGHSERTVRESIRDGDIEILRLGRNIRVLSGPLKRKLGM